MMRLVKGPYLQWPTMHSVCIVWETSCAASSTVSFWETEPVHSGLNGWRRKVKPSMRMVGILETVKIHKVMLSGLKPDTTYHYRVSSESPRGEKVESEEAPLKTAVHRDEPYSFIVTSETGGYGDQAINRQLFAQIANHRPEFLLMVGDVVGRGTDYDDWDRWLFAPGRELFKHTPFYLCLGNHEERSPWFYEFVAYPEPKNYYAFEYGNAHFVALDSTAIIDYRGGEPELVSPIEPGLAQYDFLVDDLQRTQAAWKFVFFHYPPYVSGDYQVEEMRALCPVFEQYGVDIVFSSHTIVYERSHPMREGSLDLTAGVIYVVAGGAGAKPEWFHHKRAWHTAQALAVPHFVQIVIAGKSLELRAIDIEGHVFDILALRKAGARGGAQISSW